MRFLSYFSGPGEGRALIPFCVFLRRNVINEQTFGGLKITEGGLNSCVLWMMLTSVSAADVAVKLLVSKGRFEYLVIGMFLSCFRFYDIVFIFVQSLSTTTATVASTHAIYSVGVTNLAAGCCPIDLHRGS